MRYILRRQKLLTGSTDLNGKRALHWGRRTRKARFGLLSRTRNGRKIVWPPHTVMAVGTATLDGREGAGALGSLSLCSAPKSWRRRRRQPKAAAWDVSLAGLGISPVGIDQKAGRNSQKELSFGTFEINQNGFTWPRLLQAYICLKHLSFKSKEPCLLLFLFLLPCSPHLLSLSFLLHILFPFLLPSGSPPNVKSQEDGNIKRWFGSL